MSKLRNVGKRQVLAGFALVAAVSLGMVAPANAATISRPLGGSPQVSLAGYGLGGKTGGTTNHAASSDPVVIHAPSMASSEGCPPAEDLEDGSVEVTVIHADGTEYNCNTGDYTIR